MASASPTLKQFSAEFEAPTGGPASRVGPREGWLTFLLVLFLLLSVVWSVEAADWVKDLPSLTVTVLLGSLAGLALAKVRTRSLFLHPVGLALGFLMLIWQTVGLTADGGPFARGDDLIDRFRVWVTAAESGGISADPLPFVTIVIAVAWLLSYFSSWMVFRSLRLWPILVPTALALFFNLLYLPEKFNFFFYLYILAALLLAMRLHFLKRRRQWQREQVPYFRKASTSFLGAAILLGTVVVLVAWMLPRTDFSPDILRKNWSVLSTPWKSMETELGRVLPFLPAQKPYTIYRFGDAFPFRGASRLGDHIVMMISSSRPAYWKAQTFDVYTHKGWVSGDRTKLTDEFMPEGEVASYSSIRRLDQEIELGISTDVFFAGGIPLFSTASFDIEIAPPKTFTIELDDPSRDSELPEELRPVAEALREEAREGTLTFSGEGALRLLPEDTVVKEIVRENNRAVRIELTRLPPNPPDITSMRPTGDLKPEQSYQAISYVPNASEEALRSAGTDYPSWVTDRYLQLPDDLPSRVRGLSEGLTRNRDNPYDKALAIRRWLRTIPVYSTNIDPPPQDSDGVDYFLFETKKGYSSYFASSMTVMLRSIGIPARLAVGYSTGIWDDEQQVYVVRSSNAHAWPEAYFPDYGWVPFEPVYVLDIFLRGGPTDEEEEGELAGVPRPMEAGDPPGLGEDVGSLSPGGFIGGVPVWGIVLLLAFIATLLLLLVGSVRFWFSRGLSSLNYPSLVYMKMGRLASLGGLGPRPSYTPTEYGEALATEMDVTEGHVEHIAEAYVQSRYNNQPSSREDEESLAEAWRSLRRPMLLWALKRRIFKWRLGS